MMASALWGIIARGLLCSSHKAQRFVHPSKPFVRSVPVPSQSIGDFIYLRTEEEVLEEKQSPDNKVKAVFRYQIRHLFSFGIVKW